MDCTIGMLRPDERDCTYWYVAAGLYLLICSCRMKWTVPRQESSTPRRARNGEILTKPIALDWVLRLAVLKGLAALKPFSGQSQRLLAKTSGALAKVGPGDP